MNPIKDVVIVGGGNAGLIAALYIKTFIKDINVTIVKSDKVNTIGVGEGSTEHWIEFTNHVGLDFYEIIKETDATLKIGILFEKWTSNSSSYIHNVDLPINPTIFSTLELYNQVILNNKNKKYPLSWEFEDIYLKNNIAHSPDLSPLSYQYHFDSLKLNKFLTKKCIERGINIKIHHILDIIQNPINGYITSLITSDKIDIKGDFFIDCSGFNRILSSKTKNTPISYQEYVPVNNSIVFPTTLIPNQNLEPYTTITALSSGWSWKTPTQSRYGNGYVFNDNFLSPEEALKEINIHLNTSISLDSIRNIKFQTQKLKKFWDKNYISIGLAGSFTEPLEAPSIGFSIIQSRAFIEFFKDWVIDNSISKKYNYLMDLSFDNIINFLQIHYLTKRTDTPFWKSKPFKLTKFNKETLNKFSKGIFNPIYFNYSNYLLYKQANFYQIYYGIGLLTKNNLEFSTKLLPDNILQSWKNEYNQTWKTPIGSSIPHIDYLKLVKENYSS